MKYKYVIALFLVGAILRVIGATFKFTHAPHADTILILSSIVIIPSFIIAIIKVIITKRKDSFLNK